MGWKLVRDKIPDIIRTNDHIDPRIRILAEGLQFRDALNLKIIEELNELEQAVPREKRVEELADVWEALLVRGRVQGISERHISHARTRQRSAAQGGSSQMLTLAGLFEGMREKVETLGFIPTQKERIETLARIWSDLSDLMSRYAISDYEVHKVRKKKLLERGGFEDRVALYTEE